MQTRRVAIRGHWVGGLDGTYPRLARCGSRDRQPFPPAGYSRTARFPAAPRRTTPETSSESFSANGDSPFSKPVLATLFSPASVSDPDIAVRSPS